MTSIIPISRAIELAIEHHRAGNLPEAEKIYLQILQTNPNSINALHLLGVVNNQLGKSDQALHYLGRALSLKPDFAEAHANLGNALKMQERLEEAEASYLQALSLNPHLAEAHNNLGNVLRQRGKLAEAMARYQQALRVRPEYAEAHTNLGVVLIEAAKLAEAEASLREALRLNPNLVQARHHLAVALREQGRPEEAVDHFQQALRLQPDYVEALLGLGNAFKELGYLQKTIACYKRALRLKPDYAEAHAFLGMAWLLLGNFEQGWPEYEWRWQCKGTHFVRPVVTTWDGAPLAGRTILLVAEQGLGDVLQCVRYAALVKERGGTMLMQCPAVLHPLLARCPGIDYLVKETEEPPAFDVQAPLWSLPRIFGTTVSTVPATVPYVSADPALVEKWRNELGNVSGFRIGVCWRGNPKNPGDYYRSFSPSELAPLGRMPGVRLISLQQGSGKAEPEAMPHGADADWTILELGERLDRTSGAFMDSAAIIKNLDLVVSCDTAIAHLAGALGVPVWLALARVPDWRWLLGRQDTPWYPTMRLFRQYKSGNWEDVFAAMRRELEQQIK